jgi:hypothetical protein
VQLSGERIWIAENVVVGEIPAPAVENRRKNHPVVVNVETKKTGYSHSFSPLSFHDKNQHPYAYFRVHFDNRLRCFQIQQLKSGVYVLEVRVVIQEMNPVTRSVFIFF